MKLQKIANGKLDQLSFVNFEILIVLICTTATMSWLKHLINLTQATWSCSFEIQCWITFYSPFNLCFRLDGWKKSSFNNIKPYYLNVYQFHNFNEILHHIHDRIANHTPCALSYTHTNLVAFTYMCSHVFVYKNFSLNLKCGRENMIRFSHRKYTNMTVSRGDFFISA